MDEDDRIMTGRHEIATKYMEREQGQAIAYGILYGLAAIAEAIRYAADTLTR
jgi:hypothetical protein